MIFHVKKPGFVLPFIYGLVYNQTAALVSIENILFTRGGSSNKKTTLLGVAFLLELIKSIIDIRDFVPLKDLH
jgi:hypothetical protein